MTNEELKDIIKNAKLDKELEEAEVIYQRIHANRKGRENFYRNSGIGYILDQTPVMNWSDRRAFNMMQPSHIVNRLSSTFTHILIGRLFILVLLVAFLITL